MLDGRHPLIDRGGRPKGTFAIDFDAWKEWKQTGIFTSERRTSFAASAYRSFQLPVKLEMWNELLSSQARDQKLWVLEACMHLLLCVCWHMLFCPYL